MDTFFVIALIGVLCFVSPHVSAHSGRTNSSGCHNDRKHGGYHCHGTSKPASPAQLSSPAVSPAPAGSKPEDYIAGVPSVIDGDTLEIRGQRIRLHGIDAPESQQLCKLGGKNWRCGADAANALDQKINQRVIVCTPKDRDRYGRIVAMCEVDREDINAWLVEEGYALSYRQYSHDYDAHEGRAAAKKVGLWQDQAEFIAPWDWRKLKH